MPKKYNQEEIEKKIEAIWDELEPKIAKEICMEFNLFEVCDNKTLDEVSMGTGFCHIIWRIQKKILKRDYGIIWKSPSELNPHILYD